MFLFYSLRHRLIALACLALLAAPTPVGAVEIQQVTSSGGVKAWLVEDRQNPLVSINAWWRGGSALDPNGKEGLANLVSATLDEGAGDLDTLAFRRMLEDRSIALAFEASRDGFGVSVQTLTAELDIAADLLMLAITEPRFDAEPVERVRAQITARIKRDSQNPRSVASRIWWRAVFPGHPYGRPSNGSVESVAQIERDDLVRFVKERLARNTLLVSVAGDISAEDLAPLLDRIFGGLPERAAPWTVPDAAPEATGALFVKDHAAPQSAALFGHTGIQRNHPDYYAAHLVNQILGGSGLSSRLYREVREKRGLAYGVYSYLAPLRHTAIMIGGVATQNARFAESLGTIRGEWKRMRENGPTAAELSDAKKFVTGSFALRFTTLEAIANMLTAIQIHDLGVDYINRRNALYEAVTLEDAKRVARALLSPEDLTIVVVGQPAEVISTEPLPDEPG